jgi:4-hydroxy-tetrahydrodipicolinate reductase
MINVTIAGVAGRVGVSLCKVFLADKDVKIVGATEQPGNKACGKDVGDVALLGKKINVVVNHDLKKIIKVCDVIVDFTSISSTLHHIDLAIEYSKAIVVGTTGFDDEQMQTIKAAGEKIPIVYAPNMSIGINLLFKLTKEVAKVLGDYDVELFEMHHNKKKDAPSGTAMKLANIIAEERSANKSDFTFGREGMIGERKKNEISILSSRAGDVIGEHTIIFGGQGERLELTHRAHHRGIFAQGAHKAVKWIENKENGFYTMDDVLF